ncbi:rhodanese-like domain-containing protein [Desulfopila aestuarii]|uniref:Rhodanese-like domain-containing protein n=1 Tax=Desulfopila aestuarii DSM 18488 TaxID=1121416 RepID=A0A1M7YCM0_9BACT|nr:rhodanese-like domain-containing protein [Desulfopila aestuarii]SHO50258.1 Rhodanese-like domain-containing protein [Desulfopila aestuarii DSM 18488]
MAVAIKEYGYTNVKIYNGGLKDWIGAGLPVVSDEKLPEYKTIFLSAEDVKQRMGVAEKSGCLSENGLPLLTLLDLRTERVPEGAEAPLVIRSSCQTVSGFLDDLQRDDFRKKIPVDSPIIVITETGNRDEYAARYLHKYGYNQVFGLQYGMRGWIKADYPTVSLEKQ